MDWKFVSIFMQLAMLANGKMSLVVYDSELLDFFYLIWYNPYLAAPI
jgi:hypothetical protein